MREAITLSRGECSLSTGVGLYPPRRWCTNITDEWVVASRCVRSYLCVFLYISCCLFFQAILYILFQVISVLLF